MKHFHLTQFAVAEKYSGDQAAAYRDDNPNLYRERQHRIVDRSAAGVILTDSSRDVDSRGGRQLPDATASMVMKGMGACRNVFLITGNKDGLGTAYIRGMKHADSGLPETSLA